MGRGRSKAGGAAGGAVAGGGPAFRVTTNANGTVTITPGAPSTPNPNLTNSGSGISDTNTHTTYFTPADKAIVSDDNSDGFAIAQRSGKRVPVGYYQTGYYSNVNSELRDLANGNRKALTPKTQKVVDAMDRNMRPLNNSIDTVRWTDMNAIESNLGMASGKRMTQQQRMQAVVNRLTGGDIVGRKSDYTSSSWDPKANALAGEAGRFVKIDCHYAKGAKAQFSPTRKEGEMVGARNTNQRFANARIQRMMVTNARGGRRMGDVLVIDCYIDQ